MGTGLAGLFTVWHPRYRVLIGQLLLAGTLAAGLIYAQNTLLTNLTLSLTTSGNPAPSLLRLSSLLHISLPVFILLLFIAGNLVSAIFEYWKITVIGVLRIRTRNDIETEILMHLLGREDFFFARHPPAETVNRITVDLNRICELRCLIMRIWWSAGLILSYLVFFLSKDWRLGLAVIASCAVSAVLTYRLTRHIKHLDRIYLHQDDRVKSQFEDFLHASPEVQVGHLFGRVRRIFQSVQDERTGTYLKFLNLSGILRAADALSPLAAIACTILVVIYMQHSGQGNLALALLPVMIMSLPPLFQNASDLIFLNVDVQLAYTSRDRLLEYETRELSRADMVRGILPHESGVECLPEAPGVREAGLRSAAPLRLERVTYSYNGTGRNRQGGVSEISAEFFPGRWIAIAGRAGSGKTSLVNILLGRLQPQEGRVLYGDKPVSCPCDRRSSEIFSLMPQSLALLNTTIRENLLFNSTAESEQGSSPRELTRADMEVLELAGLNTLCRLKALEMFPAASDDTALAQAGVTGIRRRARAHFGRAAGLAVLPYEDGHFDPNHWVLEIILRGKCDRRRVVHALLENGGVRGAGAFFQSGSAAVLAELGKKLLGDTRDLLHAPNFHQFSQNAALPVEEPVWRLRRDLSEALERETLSQREKPGLCVVALTAAAAEFGSCEFGGKWADPDFQKLAAAETDILKSIIGPLWKPFMPDEINPYLTWRENLAFGVAERVPDQAVMDFLEQEALGPIFTRIGLEFNIGRQGGNLSGGQGQLLALCRTLLRRTPVLILDEPTSHQDPISSARVARMLQTWKTRRIIITVSHDPNFISKADEVFLMDDGRIAANGTFDQILSMSELFRRTLWED